MPGTIDLTIDGKSYKVNWNGAGAPTADDVTDIENTIRGRRPARLPNTSRPSGLRGSLPGAQAGFVPLTPPAPGRPALGEERMQATPEKKPAGASEQELNNAWGMFGLKPPKLESGIESTKRALSNPIKKTVTEGSKKLQEIDRKDQIVKQTKEQRRKQLERIANDPNNPNSQEAKRKLYEERVREQIASGPKMTAKPSAPGKPGPNASEDEYDAWQLKNMSDDALRQEAMKRQERMLDGPEARKRFQRADKAYEERKGIGLLLDPEYKYRSLQSETKTLVDPNATTKEKLGAGANLASGWVGAVTLGSKDLVLDAAGAIAKPVLKKLGTRIAGKSAEEAVEIAMKEFKIPEHLAQKTVKEAAEAVEPVIKSGTPKIQTLKTEAIKPLSKTASKNAAMSADREAMGLDILPQTERKTFKTSLDNAEKKGLDKSAHATAQGVLEKPRALNDEETAGMTLRAAQIKNEHKQILNQIDEAIQKGEDVGALRNQLNSVESEFDTITQALKKSGTESGRSLAARKLTLADDYSLVANVQKAQAKKGSKLTTEERMTIEKLTAELEEAKNRVTQLETDSIIKRISQGQKIKASKEALAAERADLVGELRTVWKEQAGRLNANPVPIEALPVIGKLAVNLIKEGALTVAEIAVRLREYIPDVSEQDIVEALKTVDADSMKRLKGKETLRAKVAQEKAEFAIQDAIKNLAPETKAGRLRRETFDAINIPRSLMATGDMSYVLRQGAVIGASHPGRAAGAFTDAVKAYFSKNTAEEIDYVLRNSKEALKREKAGLYIAPLNRASLETAEETFMSNLAGKIPGIGKIVEASERHFVTGLNKLRADVFDDFARKYPEASDETLALYADFLNKATGRGNLGKGGAEAKAFLNAIFFSPRNAISRLQTPTALITSWKDPIARKEIAKDLAKFTGVVSTALYLAKLNGAEVNLDPHSSDFLKMKWGNTRVDILAGFQQPVRALLRIAFAGPELRSGKDVLTGKSFDRDGIFEREKRDPAKIVQQFLEYKASPPLSLGRTLITGQNAVGEKMEVDEALLRSVVPLFLQDLDETMKEQGYAKGAAFGAAGFLGAGVNTYDKNKKK